MRELALAAPHRAAPVALPQTAPFLLPALVHCPSRLGTAPTVLAVEVNAGISWIVTLKGQKYQILAALVTSKDDRCRILTLDIPGKFITQLRNHYCGVPYSLVPNAAHRPACHLYRVRTNLEEQQSPDICLGASNSKTRWGDPGKL
jgi:hypothetical protein